jgi:hypothetical protein
MKTSLDTALARLREADPMPADTTRPDAHGPALLVRILDSAGDHTVAAPDRRRRRSRPARLALAGAVAAAAAAALVAGVLPLPWSTGRVSSTAYAVTEHPDGTVDVTVHWNELRDPDALNTQLRQAGVRAAVMLYSAPRQCTTPVPLDPAYSVFHVDLREHPELANDPHAFQAYMDSLTPWIDTPPERSGDPDDMSVFTIHPDEIPSGDQLLILPRWLPPEGGTSDALELRTLIVPALPPCVPSPEESVLTRDAIEVNG